MSIKIRENFGYRDENDNSKRIKFILITSGPENFANRIESNKSLVSSKKWTNGYYRVCHCRIQGI